MKNSVNMMHMHGGDLDAIEQKYGIPKNEIIDFSGNINPMGFPESVKDSLIKNIDIVSTYPDKNYTSLRESIAEYTGADAQNITVGNGSTELISVFIKSENPKKSVIMGPAYSEYENELRSLGSEIVYFPLKEKENFRLNLPKLLEYLTWDVDMLVLCNPNNPTGTAITVGQMDEILKHCQENDIAVMVDETYIEFSDNLPEICSIPLTRKYHNLFVIRGIAKFFAAPGLRLGYGITKSKSFHNLIAKNQNPWSVNILASFAGERLFADRDFITDAKKLISSERKKIFDELSTWKNIKAYPSSSNFILIKLLTNKTDAAEIFEKLIVKKMLVRDASSFEFLDESYIRFCIMSPEDNKRLLEELKKIIE